MDTDKAVENGKILFQSAENLMQAALDLDALMESIWDLLAEETFLGGEMKDSSHADDNSGNDWITPIYSANGEVRGKGKGSPRLGTITYVVRLCGKGSLLPPLPNWPWLEQASLFVGWHKLNDYWGPEDFEPSEADNLHHRGHGLWAYRDEKDRQDYGHFFALPLFSLRTENDLKRFIVTPLKTLFQADDLEAVVKEALREVPVLLPSSG
ncbi:hypothetical protein C0U40_05865 [Amylibacter cionae]|nr:hypothetical protein C0U40_05865 [Amylibacter cionae]